MEEKKNVVLDMAWIHHVCCNHSHTPFKHWLNSITTFRLFFNWLNVTYLPLHETHIIERVLFRCEMIGEKWQKILLIFIEQVQYSGNFNAIVQINFPFTIACSLQLKFNTTWYTNNRWKQETLIQCPCKLCLSVCILSN